MTYFIRLIALLCFCFLTSLVALGQNRLKGKVVNQNNIPIEGALIVLVKEEQEEIVQYTQSDASGAFDMTIPSPDSNLKLRIQHFDYTVYRQALPSVMDNLTITLTEDITALEEIVIKPTPITQRNDTLSYNVDSFTMKSDRVLEDVLKRLPGIEVSDSGLIKYQGEAINRFYVEGLDLMKGRYSAITKSISNTDISRVDVYEDHQPIKMLDGKITTGKPALNIRLKNKISRAGTAKIGAGFNPFTWDATISPMFFSRNFQTLANYDTNNSGNTLTGKMQNFYTFQDYDTFQYSPSRSSFLKIANNADPSIKQNRYWFNKSHLGSLNVLQKLKKDWELAATIYYLNENNKANDRVQETTIHYIASPNTTTEPLNYKRIANSYTAQEVFNSSFTFTQNRKRNYVKNTTLLNVSKDKARGDLAINTADNLIQQRLNAPAFQVQNSFSTLIPLNEEHWLNFRSIVDFSKTEEDYFASPTALLHTNNQELSDYSGLIQRYNNQSFYTKNELAYAKTLNRWTLATTYTFTFQQTLFDTDLLGSTPSNDIVLSSAYLNDLRYRESSQAVRAKISYKSKRWSFNVNLPFDWTSVTLDNREKNTNDQKQKLFVSPSFYTQYVASLHWTFKGNVAYNSVFNSLTQLYPAYIFNALNFTSYASSLAPSHHFTSNVEANFKDPFNGWFVYVNLAYIQQERPLLFTRMIDENGQETIHAIEKNNTKNTKQIEFNINKLIEPINTTLKANLSYSSSLDPMLINQAYNEVETTQNTYRFNLVNTSFSWINVDYAFTYQQYKNKDFKTNNTHKITHQTTLSCIPFQQHTLLGAIAYQQDDIQQQSFTSTFLDLTYRYTFTKRKIDLELAWTNILNYRQYNQVIVNDSMTSVLSAPIRPSQLMGSIRFSF